MTVSSRLALAMVVLVVVTSCVVSAFAYYFVAEAPPHGALTAIISAALAGGADCGGVRDRSCRRNCEWFAQAAARRRWRRRGCGCSLRPEQSAAYQALIDSEQMAQAIVEDALDAFVQTDECCVVLDWSPHAEALTGGRARRPSAAAWRIWFFRNCFASCTGSGSTGS